MIVAKLLMIMIFFQTLSGCQQSEQKNKRVLFGGKEPQNSPSPSEQDIDSSDPLGADDQTVDVPAWINGINLVCQSTNIQDDMSQVRCAFIDKETGEKVAPLPENLDLVLEVKDIDGAQYTAYYDTDLGVLLVTVPTNKLESTSVSFEFENKKSKSKGQGSVGLQKAISDGAGKDTILAPGNGSLTISELGPVSTLEDTASPPIAITIGGGSGNLSCQDNLRASVDDLEKLPLENIVFAGTAPNCTLSLTPGANRNGAVVVTVLLTEGSHQVQKTFTLSITPVDDAPTISSVSDQYVLEGTNLTGLNIVISDIDSPLTCDGSLTGSSSNTSLVANVSIVLGGTAPNCTANITPEAGQNGVTIITLAATDGTSMVDQTFNLNVGLVQTFQVHRIDLEDRYEFLWSPSGFSNDITYTISKRAGATAPDTIIPGEVIHENLVYSRSSASSGGAAADGYPISFTIFACYGASNCLSKSVTIDGSFSELLNDSEGGTAKYIFASSGGGSPKLAWAEERAEIESWDGVNPAGGVTILAPGDTNCETPETTGCTVDFSALTPWTKRYLRLALPSTDSNGVSFSPVFVFGRVPDGMVYVDRDAWPDEPGMTYNDFEKFSFAIDKYEASANGTVNNCAAWPCDVGGGHLESKPGLPLVSRSWFTFKEGCSARSAEHPTYVGTYEPRKFHLATGLEWVMAAYGTPDQGGQDYCNIDGRGTSLASDAVGVNSTFKCRSLFGARNMIGNVVEWTDELLHDKSWVRFFGATIPAEVEVLAAPHPSDVTNNTTVLNWDPATAFPVIGSRPGPWNIVSDQVWKSWAGINETPTGSMAIAAERGGIHNSGTNGGRFNISFLHAPDHTHSTSGGRCALVAPQPGFANVLNDSEGDKLRLRWRVWGEHSDAVIRIGIAKAGTSDPRSYIDSWDGSEEVGSDLTDNIFTISDFSSCTDTSFNSHGFEVIGNGSINNGSLRMQSRCGVDLSGLAPWEKRYVRLYVENSSGSIMGDVFVVAKVPTGMVFVAADDWPDPSNHRLAAEYNESYSTPFDFAIDKWEASASDTVTDCSTNDFPCTSGIGGGYLTSEPAVAQASRNWYTFKQGCDARTAILGDTWADTNAVAGNPNGRRVHLTTGLEWMVASFGTPDVIGPQFCHLISSFWQPGGDETVDQANGMMERCISRYGVRHMIGNLWELTDDLVHNGKVVRHWTEGGNGIDIGLAGTWNIPQNFITGWDFEKGFPTSSGAKADSFHHADYLWNNWDIGDTLAIFGPEAKIATRGGAPNWQIQGGRFAMSVFDPPTHTFPRTGGRCALSAPAN